MNSTSISKRPSRAGIDIGARKQYFKANPGAAWQRDGPGMPCECKEAAQKITMCCRKMKYVQPDIPSSYKPSVMYKRPENGLESDTVYKRSYMGHDKMDRVEAIRQKDNLHSAGEMSNDTTHKMSYRGWPCADPATAILPLGHDLFEDGPLQSLTTNRHDYTPKPYSKMRPFHPCQQIKPSDKPMEDTSTMLSSYQAPDHAKLKPAVSFKPEIMYKKPSMPFQDKTVQKMSYQPWPIEDKEEFPWAAKGKYQPPQSAMEGDTVYNTSFGAPGHYLPAEKDEDGCYYCNPIDCVNENLPPQCVDQATVPDYKVCSYPNECRERSPPVVNGNDEGCYCYYPKECAEQPQSYQMDLNTNNRPQEELFI